MKLPGVAHTVKLPDSQEIKDKILSEQGQAQTQMGLSSNEADVGAIWETAHNMGEAEQRTLHNREKETESEATHEKPKDKDPKEDGQEAVRAKKEPGTSSSGDKSSQKDLPKPPKKPKKAKPSLNIENRYALIEMNTLYQRFPRSTGGLTQLIRFTGSKEQAKKIPPFDVELAEGNNTVITIDGVNYELNADSPCRGSGYCRQYQQSLLDDESSYMPLVNAICELRRFPPTALSPAKHTGHRYQQTFVLLFYPIQRFGLVHTSKPEILLWFIRQNP